MSSLQNKKQTPDIFGQKTLIVLLALVGIALLVTLRALYSVRSELNSLVAVQFVGQQQQAKSCGLLTTKEAAALLLSQDIATGGTLIDANAPTAASREGSPRVDSCSHVVRGANGAYIDIVLKTYDSNEAASENYKNIVQKVLFVQKQSSLIMPIEELYYAAGVHYAKLQNTVLEISAAKVGAAVGEQQQVFSREVLQKIVTKL